MGDDAYGATPDDEGDHAPARDSAPRDRAPDRRAYASAADDALGRPLRDFIPAGIAALLLLTCGGLAAVGTIALGHIVRSRVGGPLGPAAASVLDLKDPRSASGWLAAMLLAAASLVAWFVYSLRRHRVDDYYGRYRVWIWTALACLVVSLGEASSLPMLARGLFDRAAQASNVSEPLVWQACVATLLAVAGLRLALEMWRCRGALALLMVCAASFLVAAAANHGWLLRDAADHRLLVEHAAWLAGYVVLLTTLLVYARYVTLEIEGKVAVAPAKPRVAKKKKAPRQAIEEDRAEAARKPAGDVRTDLGPTPSRSAHAPVSHLGAQRGAMPGRSGPVDASEDEDEKYHRPLSRAERKRLKREARMQGRSAA
jgi:hypothetical protein